MLSILRRLIGLGFVGVGIYFIYFSVTGFQYAAEEKGLGRDFKNFFAHNPMWNPIITFFGGRPEYELPAYNPALLYYLIGGIVLVIVGGVLIFSVGRRKN